MSRELPVTDCGRKKVFASRAPCGMTQPHRVQLSFLVHQYQRGIGERPSMEFYGARAR